MYEDASPSTGLGQYSSASHVGAASSSAPTVPCIKKLRFYFISFNYLYYYYIKD
ncbi:uncharacterized protein TRIREDRAFT_104716 [Trichoderma reesei QM6a]|uniref:Predicted protein n=1 Tax=Hypocrea jecorina (strain QM6a) TaxID=431241 RepID=G0RDG3_HYPJQ|nr:uncharacterized protein TRIREDRAFT_104716 [Trichoderma reesei QM6a]EGR50800.1 predicted protein [Trichoderma reesei QM6a]